ncbi:MAG: 3-isopropylmalate dehydrogenase, partial [Clostridia bacterium]|nr:3-isopropylmalate dehydrogenase [Clostridia bacterium]
MTDVLILAGDGIGQEVMQEAEKVLAAAEKKYKFALSKKVGLIGGVAYDQTGSPFPADTQQACLESRAVLLGAVGGPRWDNLPQADLRPERGALLPLRKLLGAYANLRPVKVFPALLGASTLKPEVLQGLDLLIVRELTGGLYFGRKRREKLPDGERVTDTLVYTAAEIKRVAHKAFALARQRRRKLTLVDKANILESSLLWREVVGQMSGQYPEVTVNYLLVDNCAMQLIRKPQQFDVLLTENMFGDILSDEAAQLTGSLGMLPSASLGERSGLFEPIHGSAPDIAGQNLANPLAMILSVALMLRYIFGQEQAARGIERAVEEVLAAGFRTLDIAEAA